MDLVIIVIKLLVIAAVVVNLMVVLVVDLAFGRNLVLRQELPCLHPYHRRKVPSFT